MKHPGTSTQKRRRALLRRGAVAVVLGPLFLTGCAAGSEGPPPQAKNPTAAPTADTHGITMPTGFVDARAWSLDVREREYAVAPGANRILDVYALGDAAEGPAPAGSDAPGEPEPTMVFARAADDGAVVWRSLPLSLLTDQAAPVIEVLATAQGEIGIVARVGTIRGTGMVRDKRMLTVDSYRVASSGEGVAPLQHLERQVPDDTGSPPITVGAGGVLLTVDAGGETPAGLQQWDPSSGKVDNVPALPDETRVILPTANGLLVAKEHLSNDKGSNCKYASFPCARGFGILGKWNAASDIAPKNSLAVPLIVTRSAVLAGWWDQQFDPGDAMHYTVHDLATGRILASVDCRPVFDRKNPPGDGDTGAAASSDGRYLVAGAAVFDVSAASAACLDGDERTKGVDLLAVSDAGVAYGWVDEAGGATLSLHIPSRKIDVLPEGTSIPDLLTRSGAGIYRVPFPKDEGRGTAEIVVFPPG